MGRRGLILFAFLFSGCQHASRSEQQKIEPAGASSLYEQPRQITFVGPRAGEGYFGPGGRQLIFQSERVRYNPFYQIYLKDLKTGDTKRLSSGEGKTTCAWLHPSGRKALYASTHNDPNWREKARDQIETRKRGEREKYAWSYDDHFDLYEQDLSAGTLRALAPAKGYDAEGSYSPDGQWIAFASNRHAYTSKLNEKEFKRRSDDPSFFLDIYIMRANGTGLKRLTRSEGYDGGPFFSPDGKSIVWRRFTPDGRIAEIWTMNVDGSESKAITHLGAMSWAPFYHPSGEYIVFTTNLLGYDNFELYLVDRKGQHEPVRVTNWVGFDGLPVFSPDGATLSWSHKNEKGESQIYLAKWNDERARAALGLPPVSRPPATAVGQPISDQSVRAWVNYLASAEMKGRPSGSLEERKYTAGIAKEFGRLGLTPLPQREFVQPFQYTSGIQPKGKNELSVEWGSKREHLPLGERWVPYSFSGNGVIAPLEVMFAGYGIVAPATADQPTYDSYQGLDVKGRWALVFPDLPEDLSNERRFHLNQYARIQHKALVAKQAGALGLIVIGGNDKAKIKYEGAGEGSLPTFEISWALAQEWMKPTGKDLKDLTRALAKGETMGILLAQIKVGAEIGLESEHAQALNVVGQIVVPGSQGTIMVGAHGDHLGLGEHGNSLAKDKERSQIHFGADDNASGVAAVVELARWFAEGIRAGAIHSKYNLAFAVWSGEELGLLGSTNFLKANENFKVHAYVNLDMVGRLRNQLLIQGTGSADQWPEIFEKLAVRTEVPLSLQEDPYLPTDAMAFYLKGIPAISFFTGAHAEYHSPRDRVETLNFPGIVSTALVAKGAIEALASGAPLTYKKVEGQRPSTQGRGFRLYLGTIPDYSQEGIKGVKISGTTNASPAEKAGLKEGDVIVQLGGIQIENIHDYVYCLQAMKANERTPIKVLRQGQVVELEITPVPKGM